MILTYKNKEEKEINSILKNDLQISSRLLLKLINNKKIFVNNKNTNTKNIAQINDIIKIDFNYEEDNSNIIPTKMNLKIIYEDNWLLIVDKPAGIPVHSSLLHYTDSLSNGIKYYFDTINLKKKIRPVNRLDLNTSGLVVFAKNEYIQECLIKQMGKTFQKTYIAIINGILPISNKINSIDAPISRKTGSIIERCVNPNGQKSITHYKVLKNFDTYSLIELFLETGRTHQIRVHMAYIGHSLLGDSLYGTKSNLINRHALHCQKLSFLHPITKKHLEFTLNLPNDMQILTK